MNINKNKDLRGSRVGLFLFSETMTVPVQVEGFKLENYRSTGVVLPFEEFTGPINVMNFAKDLQVLERKFTTGDALVLLLPAISRIMTFVVLSRQSPLLKGDTPMRLIVEQDGKGDFLLQLPESFQPGLF